MNTEQFINKANIIHNGKYDYSEVVYKKSNEKVKIICKLHGEFWQNPSNHICLKQGCIKCRNEMFSKLNTLSLEEFITSAIKIHGDKYNYSNVKYAHGKKEVCIICPLHGTFYQTPSIHLAGHGCLTCGRIKKAKSDAVNKEEFIERSIQLHKSKYDYSLVDYKSLYIKVKILCPLHGVFYQSPDTHLQNHGCPRCNSSKGELKISNFLKVNNINHISQQIFSNCRNPKTNTPLRFDFYVPDKNLLIEFDGIQHFMSGIKLSGGHCGSEEDLKYTQYKDNIKNEYAKSNGINLLRIKYDKLNKIDEILTDALK